MFDALAVGGEGAAAVESIDGAVEGLVCFAVVGERCVGAGSAAAKLREQEPCLHWGFRLYW